MRFTRVRTRVGRMLAVAILVLAAVPASLVTATAASAATDPACAAIPSGSSNGIPDYELPTNCPDDVISQVHTCQQVANFNGAVAVECADMHFTNSGSSKYLRGVGKFYCQGTFGQCAGMNVTTTMVYQVQREVVSTMVTPVNYKCNPSPGPACPGNSVNGAKLVYTGAGHTYPGTPGDPSDPPENCVLGQTFILADGATVFGGKWNNVMQAKSGPAVHETHQQPSIKANFCFD